MNPSEILGPLAGMFTAFVERVVEEKVRYLVPPPREEPPPDPAYTVKEAAKLLGLSEYQTREHCREGKYGGRIGAQYRILQSEIDRYLKGRAFVHGEGKA